jgi:hypothetical protein
MEEILFDENEDWEKRTLCSDESCIGTIGTDNRCKECGKPYEGAQHVSVPAIHTEQSSSDLTNTSQSQETIKSNSVEDPVDDDWDNRVLCSDGCCIGTIGPDGRCNECGKPLN